LTTGDEGKLKPLPIEELLELKMGESYAKLAGGRAVKLCMPAPLRVENLPLGREVIARSWERYGAPLVSPEVPMREEVAAPPPVPVSPPSPPIPPAVVPPPVVVPVAQPSPQKPTRQAKEKKSSSVPAPLGRGGPEHQYLQELVKRFGEAQGFRVTIEDPVLDGQGSVDVVLERERLRIACEISVTTGVEHEVGNVEKCLAAGFGEVAVISPKERHLAKIKKALGKRLSPEAMSRVHFFVPEEFGAYLDTIPLSEEKVETVGGYQVKVSYRRPTPKEAGARTKAVASVIARSLKRMQGKSE
jgi:hypothetical protein